MISNFIESGKANSSESVVVVVVVVVAAVVVVVVVVNCERTPKCKRSQFIFIQSKSGISVVRKSFSVSLVPL